MLRSQTPKKKNADVGINARPHRVAFTEGHLPSQIYSWSSPQLPVGGDLLDRVQTLQQRVGQLTRTGVISYVYAHLIPRSALVVKNTGTFLTTHPTPRGGKHTTRATELTDPISRYRHRPATDPWHLYNTRKQFPVYNPSLAREHVKLLMI